MQCQITALATYEYVLVLNPMMSNTEARADFGPFPTKEALMVFYNAEKVEPYKDEGVDTFCDPYNKTGKKMYRKCFRKGGPLEWMNPLNEQEMQEPGLFGHGIHEVLVKLDNIQRQSYYG